LRIILVAAATIAAIAAAPGTWAEDSQNFNQNPFRCDGRAFRICGHGHKRGGIGSVACNDGNVVFSPSSLWPPNHKLVTIDIAYVDNDNDADSTGHRSIRSLQTRTQKTQPEHAAPPGRIGYLTARR
jgi:hypothetical protein